MSTAAESLIPIVHTMGFIHQKKFLEPHKKMVFETMSTTIMKRARSLRMHARLPLYFWADVVDIVVYLISRGPSSSLDGGNPKGGMDRHKGNSARLG